MTFALEEMKTFTWHTTGVKVTQISRYIRRYNLYAL
jgi:hypothetical protein